MLKKSSVAAAKLKKLVNRQRVQTVFSFALGGLLVFQMVQFYQFRERLAFIDDLYDRNANVLTDLNKSKDYLSSFGSDLNEIRHFLLLPVKSYDFSSMDEVDLASDEAMDLNTQLFDFVDSLGKYQENEERYTANLTAVKAALNDPVWSQSGLRLVSSDGQVLDDRVEFVFMDDSVSATALKVDLGYDGLFTVPLYYRELELTDRSSWPSVLAEVQEFLKNDLAAQREQVKTVHAARESMKSLLASEAVGQVLKDKQMALSGEQENEETFFYQLRNSQLAALGTFSVSKQNGAMEFSVEAPVGEAIADLSLDGSVSEDLLAELRDQVDARTDMQKKVASAREELEVTMADKAFLATLDKLGMHVGDVTETDTQIQYPLLGADETPLRILFIDKATAEVKVSLPDGQEVKSLSMATEELSSSSKKKAWICLSLSPVTLG